MLPEGVDLKGVILTGKCSLANNKSSLFYPFLREDMKKKQKYFTKGLMKIIIHV